MACHHGNAAPRLNGNPFLNGNPGLNGPVSPDQGNLTLLPVYGYQCSDLSTCCIYLNKI